MPYQISLHPKLKFAACLEQRKKRRKPSQLAPFKVTEDWIKNFSALVHRHYPTTLQLQDNPVTQEQIETHIRHLPSFAYKHIDEVYALLNFIYALMSGKIKDQTLNFESANNSAYAEKLYEGLSSCAAGLHDRLIFLWCSLALEKNFAERLETIRETIIRQAIHTRSDIMNLPTGQKIDEVHAANQLMIAVQKYFGINIAHQNDPHPGYIYDKPEALSHILSTFCQKYTPINIIRKLQEQLASAFYHYGYHGRVHPDNAYEGCSLWLDLLAQFFPKATVKPAFFITVSADDERVIDLNWQLINTQIIKQLEDEGLIHANSNPLDLLTPGNWEEECYYYLNIAASKAQRYWLENIHALNQLAFICCQSHANDCFLPIVAQQLKSQFEKHPNPMEALEQIISLLPVAHCAPIILEILQHLGTELWVNLRSKQGDSIFEILLRFGSRQLIDAFLHDLENLPAAERLAILITNRQISNIPQVQALSLRLLSIYCETLPLLSAIFLNSFLTDLRPKCLEWLVKNPEVLQTYLHFSLLLVKQHNDFRLIKILLLKLILESKDELSASAVLNTIKQLPIISQQHIFEATDLINKAISHRAPTSVVLVRFIVDLLNLHQANTAALFLERDSIGMNPLFNLVAYAPDHWEDILTLLRLLPEILVVKMSTACNIKGLSLFQIAHDYKQFALIPTLTKFLSHFVQYEEVASLLHHNLVLISKAFVRFAQEFPQKGQMLLEVIEAFKDIDEDIRRAVYEQLDKYYQPSHYAQLLYPRSKFSIQLFIATKHYQHQLHHVGKLLIKLIERCETDEQQVVEFLAHIASLTADEQALIFSLSANETNKDLIEALFNHPNITPSVLKIILALPSQDMITHFFETVVDFYQHDLINHLSANTELYITAKHYLQDHEAIRKQLLSAITQQRSFTRSFIFCLEKMPQSSQQHMINIDVLSAALQHSLACFKQLFVLVKQWTNETIVHLLYEKDTNGFNLLIIAAQVQPDAVALLLETLTDLNEPALTTTIFHDSSTTITYKTTGHFKLYSPWHSSFDLFIAQKHFFHHYADFGAQLIIHIVERSLHLPKLVQSLTTLPQDIQIQALREMHPVVHEPVLQLALLHSPKIFIDLLRMMRTWSDKVSAVNLLTMKQKNGWNLFHLTFMYHVVAIPELLETLNELLDFPEIEQLILHSLNTIAHGLLNALSQCPALRFEIPRGIAAFKNPTIKRRLYIQLAQQFISPLPEVFISLFIATHHALEQYGAIAKALQWEIINKRETNTKEILDFVQTQSEDVQIQILNQELPGSLDKPIALLVKNLHNLLPNVLGYVNKWNNEQAKTQILSTVTSSKSNLLQLTLMHCPQHLPMVLESMQQTSDMPWESQMECVNSEGNSTLATAATYYPQALYFLVQSFKTISDHTIIQAALCTTDKKGNHPLMILVQHHWTLASNLLPQLLTEIDHLADTATKIALYTKKNSAGKQFLDLIIQQTPELIPHVFERILLFPAAIKAQLIQPLNFSKVSKDILLALLKLAKKTSCNEDLVKAVLKVQNKFTPEDWFTIVNENLIDSKLIKNKKETVLGYIKTLKTNVTTVVDQSLNYHTYLGQFFFTRRGLLPCRKSAGTLKQLVQFKTSITDEDKPQPSKVPSK